MKRPPAHSVEPLSRFLDEYLSYLYETCPTAAAADGVHLHDDLVEDFSRAAIDARIRELGGWMRRLDGITGATLTTGEKLDRQRLADCIRARLFDLEEVATWRRSPRHYAETLALSLAGQLLFDHAPVEQRARRVVSKLRQTPRLMEAARQNVTDPPGLFVRAGLESCAGVITFIERDLPRAFHDLEDMHLLGDLADASTVAVDALRDYAEHLRDNGARRSRASFRLGADRFAQKLRLEDGIDLPVDRLLAIVLRELAATQEEFRKVAAGLNGDWTAAWQEVQSGHPAAGRAAGRCQAAGRGAGDVRGTEADRVAAGPRAARGGADPGVLPLDVREPVDGGPVRGEGRCPPITTSRTSTRPGRRNGRSSTSGASTRRRCGRSRSTRPIRATSSSSSISGRTSSRRSASRPCSHPLRSSRVGRTTANR